MITRCSFQNYITPFQKLQDDVWTEREVIMDRAGYMENVSLKDKYTELKREGRGIKDPFSCLSHLIFAFIMIPASIPLLTRAAAYSGTVNVFSMSLFVCSMLALYLSSALYHGFDISEKANKVLRKLDHSMIYVLIAGTYSPVCLVVLNNTKGDVMFMIIWGLAFAGILLSILWINCPKWLSSIIYILMGWTCIFAFGDLMAKLPAPAFWWLLTGGIIYTVGGVIYALKLPLFTNMSKGFGNHELFHLFVIGGSVCHYMMMLLYVAKM